MTQRLAHVAVVVKDYDEAIDLYVNKLGFDLVDDTAQPEQDKRWVVVRPVGGETSILLARAASDRQASRIGDQTGGRVFLFLETDDFARDYEMYRERGVAFVRPPTVESYGRVAVFRDVSGNLCDGSRVVATVSAISVSSSLL